MKRFAIAALLVTLAGSAHAAVVWNEGVNGDLSTNPAAPTALVFAIGGNTVTGSVINSAGVGGDRDYIKFTIGAGQTLAGLNLLNWAPNNLGFLAFNAGATSYVPSAVTDPNFLAGIHANSALIGMDLMPFFVSSAVTTNSLATPSLGPGTYCFLVQQTNNILQQYSFEFVIEQSVPANGTSWGKIKALYR